MESLSARGGKSAAAAALVVRARFRLRLGKVDEAAADLEEGLRRFGRGSGPQRAEALLHLGHALLVRGKFVDARARLEEAISLARRHGRARLLVDALDRLGHASLDEGRLEEARALFDESLRRAHALPSEAAVAHATAELGLVDYFAGDLDAAGKRLDEGVRRARALGNRALLADALNGLAFVAEDRGDLDGAAALYRESLSVCREEGDRFGAGRALMLLGENDRRRGDPEGARRWYEASLELNRAIGSTYACGLLEGNLAYLAASEGMEERASAHAAEAFRAYRETGSMTVGIPVLVALAEVFVGRGEIARALALLGCARDHPGNRQDHRFEIERVLARVRREAPGADLPAGLAKGAGRSLEKLADSALGRLR